MTNITGRAKRWLRSSWLSIRRARASSVIAAAAVLLIFVDTFVKPLSVVSLGLVVLALAPWIVRFIKSMELPGGIKFDFRELEAVERKAEDAGLLADPPAAPDIPTYKAIFPSDPTLALAGLRIELERKVNDIADTKGVYLDRKPRSLTQTILALRHAGVLRQDQSSVLADLVPLLNRAIHAADYDPIAAEWAMEVGPRLLAGLDELLPRTGLL